MKSNPILKLGLLLLIFLTTPVRADVLVLVHGWAANSDTWLRSGVVAALENKGWQDAGVLSTFPAGVTLLPARPITGKNRIYRVHLPAEAPLTIQATHLSALLRNIHQRHPNEPLLLAGHSAGGVVARLAIVAHQAPKIDTLITIASPNLGTIQAVRGIDYVEDQPFFCPGPGIDFVKSMFGGDDYDYLDYSRPLLYDLVPATPGTLLGWLNQQPHPNIRYHAVIRGYMGDELVPSFSQDMNMAPALRGRVTLHNSLGGHALNYGDGIIIGEIITRQL
jgi:pimeloyl-ACP methyl ester carboxylesterase